MFRMTASPRTFLAVIGIAFCRLMAEAALVVPSGYQEVEYIKAANGQYVDTGYVTKLNSEFRFKYSMVCSGYLGAFGTRPGDHVNSMRIVPENGSTTTLLAYFMSDSTDGWTRLPSATSGDNQLVEGVFNKDRVTINGRSWTVDRSHQGSSDTQPVYILRVNGRGGTTVTLYYFQIWEDGVLIHDYVPCRRTGDSRTGLYDLVADVFLPVSYDAAGPQQECACGPVVRRRIVTGTLAETLRVAPGYGSSAQKPGMKTTASAPRRQLMGTTLYACDGYNLYTNAPDNAANWMLWKRSCRENLEYTQPTNADVKLEWIGRVRTGLPTGLRQVESLRSRGDAYIDTGYVTTLATEFRFDYAMTCSGYQGPFGTRPSNHSSCTRLVANDGSKTDVVAYFMSDSTDGYKILEGVTSADYQRVEGYLNSTTVYANGKQTAVYRGVVGSGDTSSVYLFRINRPDVATGTVMTIYLFSIYENGVCMRDYIPCQRLSDGTGVLLETVSGAIAETRGSGDFETGKLVWPEDHTVYTWKPTVTDGAWDDPANWSAAGDCVVGFPMSSGASAVFPAGTQATVTFPETPARPDRVNLEASNLQLHFTGGVWKADGTAANPLVSAVSIGTTEALVAGTHQANRILFDGVAVETTESLRFVYDTRVILTNAATYRVAKSLLMGYGDGSTINKIHGNGWMDVTAGALLTLGESIALGDKFMLTVDNATVETKDLYFDCRTGGGTLRVAGTNPVVKVSGVCATESTFYVTNLVGGFEFSIPVGGYQTIPIQGAKSLVATGTGWTDRSNVWFRVDLESPIFAVEGVADVALASAKSGLGLAHIALETLPRNLRASFVCAAESKPPFTWEPVEAGATGKCALALRIERKPGSVLVVR